MGRLKKIKDLRDKLFHKKKNKDSHVKTNEKGKVVAKTITEKTTVGAEELNASKTMCYVVQGDLLLIGTRGELELKLNKKIGILELDTHTQAKIESKAKFINKTFTKVAQAAVELEAKSKSSAKLGEHVEADLELEAKIDATATAIVDLTSLMIELGVDVNANMKIEGSVSLDLKIIDVKAFMTGELVAKASAKASVSWKGVEASATASAEAKATLGAEISSKPFKIGNNTVKLILKPSITAYARAEAKATAAAGLKTGVSIGAAAAVGLRGTIEAVINGNYTIKEGLDELNRTVDANTGKSKASPDVSDKDLGTLGAELELELSVGAEFDVSPFSFSVEKENGYEYAVGTGHIKMDVPGILSGPAGVGMGINIYVKVLYEIVDDILEKLKKAIKDFVLNVVVKYLEKEFKKFMKEVEALAKEVHDFGLDVTISFLDFIGKDLTAIDVQIKKYDNRLLDLNKIYMADQSNEANKKKLEDKFAAYNTYVEKAFGAQQTKINAIIKAAEEKMQAIEENGDLVKEAKAIKKAKAKTKDTMRRLKELINTKKGIIIYLEPNRKVLKLNPSILKDTKGHLDEMVDTYKVLKDFAETVS